MKGIELIAKERQEQIEKHQFTIEHDSKFKDGELIVFANYLLLSNEDKIPKEFNQDMVRQIHCKPYIQQLSIAGALIAAEIDRILNLKQTT